MIKVCQQCGKEFPLKKGCIGKYCSRRCNGMANYEKYLNGKQASWTGKKHTEEYKQLMRQKMTGRIISEETREKIRQSKIGMEYITGWHHSEETRQKISLVKKGKPSLLKGRTLSDKRKEEMSIQRKGMSSPLQGKHHSEETRRKLSLVRKEFHAKMTPEEKEKFRQIRRGAVIPIERRIKMSEITKLRYKDIKKKPDEKQIIQDIRNSLETKLWREAIYKRDNYTCVICNKTKSGYLHGHHIKSFKDYPELRFAIDNGITVCAPCHMLIHSKKVFLLREAV